MMMHPPRLPLEKEQRKLSSRSLINYKAIVYAVCRIHAEFEPCQTASQLLREDRIDELVLFADSLSEQMYPDAMQQYMASQLSALVRKYPFPPGSHSFDPEAKARAKFASSEHKCLRINERFRARRNRIGLHPYEPLLYKMRGFIAHVLGDEPNIRMVYDNCGFGPGASLGVHGNATNSFRKLTAERWSVSPGAFYHAYSAVRANAHVFSILNPEDNGFLPPSDQLGRKAFAEKICMVNHNSITFVPKTVTTHRSIAVEPLLNGYVQKGVDVVMRLLLKRVGIDLTDQTHNARLAREGSVVGSEDPFCTIDLSSASDSIAVEVVRELLPPEWFSLLATLRSTHYSDENVVRRFEKFCSMGNGFCFPLETLIFAAACHAVGAGRPGRDFLVYGDDIIVRKSSFAPLIALLGYLGFKVNTAKTFGEGPFRESCGTDWFDGQDIRPYVLDHAFDSVENVYKFVNMIRANDLWSWFFGKSWEILLNDVSPTLHLWRPYRGQSDTGLDSHEDEFLRSPNCTYKRKTRTWMWKELEHAPVADPLYNRVRHGKEASTALMYAAMLGTASSKPFTVRRLTRTRVRLVSHPGATSQWLPPY